VKISKRVIDTLNHTISGKPPETGGIIGSADGDIIDRVIMDIPTVPADRMCCYIPNVDFFNEVIATWQHEGIEFKGMFHTHFANVETLSHADKQYITAIMNAMPPEIVYLYFPVFVLPARTLICYKAIKNEGNIDILRDEVTIRT